jgi:hypothetical protein
VFHFSNGRYEARRERPHRGARASALLLVGVFQLWFMRPNSARLAAGGAGKESGMPTASELIDVDVLRDLMERAEHKIQMAMNYADFELMEGETPTFLAKLAEIRQIVTEFSDTAQHLMQQKFGATEKPLRPSYFGHLMKEQSEV